MPIDPWGQDTSKRVEFHRSCIVLSSLGHPQKPLRICPIPQMTPASSRPAALLVDHDPKMLKDFLDATALVAAGPAEKKDVKSATLDREKGSKSIWNVRIGGNLPFPPGRLAEIREMWEDAFEIERGCEALESLRKLAVAESIIYIRSEHILKVTDDPKKVQREKMSANLRDLWALYDLLRLPNHVQACQTYPRTPVGGLATMNLVQSLILIERKLDMLLDKEKNTFGIASLRRLIYFHDAAKSIARFANFCYANKITLEFKPLNAHPHPVSCWEAVRADEESIYQQAATLAGTEGMEKAEKCLAKDSKFCQHAEMTSLLFYEENTRYQPLINYIACNLRPCFMCHYFIKLHGYWEMRESSMMIFAPWNMRSDLRIAYRNRGKALQDVLKKLCNAVRDHLAAELRRARGLIDPVLDQEPSSAEALVLRTKALNLQAADVKRRPNQHRQRARFDVS